LKSALDVAEDIAAPDPNNTIAENLESCVTLLVGHTVGMLAAVDLHHEMQIAADEVREISLPMLDTCPVRLSPPRPLHFGTLDP
jgi:hypothetical protein